MTASNQTKRQECRLTPPPCSPSGACGFCCAYSKLLRSWRSLNQNCVIAAIRVYPRGKVEMVEGDPGGEVRRDQLAMMLVT